jgi:hypothetical protein
MDDEVINGNGTNGNGEEGEPTPIKDVMADPFLKDKLMKTAQELIEKKEEALKKLEKRLTTFSRAASFLKGEAEFLRGRKAKEKTSLANDLQEIINILKG